jgi:hypothetical protein
MCGLIEGAQPEGGSFTPADSLLSGLGPFLCHVRTDNMIFCISNGCHGPRSMMFVILHRAHGSAAPISGHQGLSAGQHRSNTVTVIVTVACFGICLNTRRSQRGSILMGAQPSGSPTHPQGVLEFV